MAQGLTQQAITMEHMLRGFLRGKTHGNQDVDDLVQEVYVRVLVAKERELIEDPHRYIIRVACNVLWRWGRERKRALSEDGDLPEITPYEYETNNTRAEIASEILSTLTAIESSVLLLHYLYGFSYVEISTALGISSHQVERYLLNAKKHAGDLNGKT